MSYVLILSSSALGDLSASNELIRELEARLRTRTPGIRIEHRDLNAAHIPHLDTDSASVIRGIEAKNPAQAAALALSNQLIEELKGAKAVVIGAPMYNFGLPATLKAWFDYVLRSGITFRYTQTGPEGLVGNKPVIVIKSSNGFYSEGPAQPMDAHEPHIRTLLTFIGLSNLTFVRAEKLGFGPEAREQSLKAAHQQIADIVREGFSK